LIGDIVTTMNTLIIIIFFKCLYTMYWFAYVRLY